MAFLAIAFSVEQSARRMKHSVVRLDGRPFVFAVVVALDRGLEIMIGLPKLFGNQAFGC
jgi:hypothetical protein